MNTNIKEIFGNWDKGYVLDKHTLRSTYLGDNEYGRAQFDMVRSEIGEALFKLKYRREWAQTAGLAGEIVRSVVPRLEKIGFIVPMPATIARAWQPVSEISKAVGAAIDVPVFENVIIKAPATESGTQLKSMGAKGEKAAALAGRFMLSEAITNEGRWNALLLDDLHDTGASMEAACAVLRTYRKIAKMYVAALTWK